MAWSGAPSRTRTAAATRCVSESRGRSHRARLRKASASRGRCRALGQPHRPVQGRLRRVRVDGGQRLRTQGLYVHPGRGGTVEGQGRVLGCLAPPEETHRNQEDHGRREAERPALLQAEAPPLGQCPVGQNADGHGSRGGACLQFQRKVEDVVQHQGRHPARRGPFQGRRIPAQRPHRRPDGQGQKPDGSGQAEVRCPLQRPVLRVREGVVRALRLPAREAQGKGAAAKAQWPDVQRGPRKHGPEFHLGLPQLLQAVQGGEAGGDSVHREEGRQRQHPGNTRRDKEETLAAIARRRARTVRLPATQRHAPQHQRQDEGQLPRDEEKNSTARERQEGRRAAAHRESQPQGGAWTLGRLSRKREEKHRGKRQKAGQVVGVSKGGEERQLGVLEGVQPEEGVRVGQRMAVAHQRHGHAHKANPRGQSPAAPATARKLCCRGQRGRQSERPRHLHPGGRGVQRDGPGAHQAHR